MEIQGAIPDVESDGTGDIMTNRCGMISWEALNIVYFYYSYKTERRYRFLDNMILVHRAELNSSPGK